MLNFRKPGRFQKWVESSGDGGLKSESNVFSLRYLLLFYSAILLPAMRHQRRYYIRPTQRTLRLCRSAHGCLHPNDKRVETQSTFDAISDLETATTGVVPKRPGDSSQRSRRSVSFKCLPLDAQASWDRDFGSTSRGSLGERVCRKTHPNPAIGNLDHSLKQDCVTIPIYLKGASDGQTKNLHPRV